MTSYLTHLDSGHKPPLDDFINVLQLVEVGQRNLVTMRHKILEDRLAKPGVAQLECHLKVLGVVVKDVNQRIVIKLVNILHVLQADLLACQGNCIIIFKLIKMINPPSIML